MVLCSCQNHFHSPHLYISAASNLTVLSLCVCVCVCFCARIYERLIDPPQTELTAGSGVWLGQHTHKHGLFKVRLGPRLRPPHTELRAAVSELGNGIGQGGTSARGLVYGTRGEARGG